MKTVLFDFDGTLTTRDTLRPLAHYLAEIKKERLKLFFFYLLLILYKLNLIDDHQLKQKFLTIFLNKESLTNVKSIVKCFLADKLESLINLPAFSKLKEHLSMGDRVYLVSANFDFFLEPLIEKWKLSGLISTETEKQNTCLTGKIIGPTCKGKYKVEKVVKKFGAAAMIDMVVYGDNEDDCLLQNVGTGINLSKP